MAIQINHVVVPGISNGTYLMYVTATKIVIEKADDLALANAQGRKSPYMMVEIRHGEIIHLHVIPENLTSSEVINLFCTDL